jgi:double-stranded uracil-DNA glycosylase
VSVKKIMAEPLHTRPDRAEIQAAAGKTVADVIAANLCILFVGINPGLYTAAIGHHFGRPGNRFWPVLYAAGFTDRLFSPYEERELLPLGLGITNIVARATATAEELAAEELRAGARHLEEKIAVYTPAYLAVLGVSAYRSAFQQPKAAIGLQPEKISGAKIWVLPNPSGLNAHYQKEALAEMFRRLRLEVGHSSKPAGPETT